MDDLKLAKEFIEICNRNNKDTKSIELIKDCLNYTDEENSLLDIASYSMINLLVNINKLNFNLNHRDKLGNTPYINLLDRCRKDKMIGFANCLYQSNNNRYNPYPELQKYFKTSFKYRNDKAFTIVKNSFNNEDMLSKFNQILKKLEEGLGFKLAYQITSEPAPYYSYDNDPMYSLEIEISFDQAMKYYISQNPNQDLVIPISKMGAAKGFAIALSLPQDIGQNLAEYIDVPTTVNLSRVSRIVREKAMTKGNMGR